MEEKNVQNNYSFPPPPKAGEVLTSFGLYYHDEVVGGIVYDKLDSDRTYAHKNILFTTDPMREMVLWEM
mgnify:CR=1 FL=1